MTRSGFGASTKVLTSIESVPIYGHGVISMLQITHKKRVSNLLKNGHLPKFFSTGQ
jgi:hypothetical protein